MTTSATGKPNYPYIIGVSMLTFILPAVSYAIELLLTRRQTGPSLQGFGKWFIFYAVGFRLLVAGIRQSLKPAFTAKVVFHMESAESYPVIRELGFANLCFGLIGLISLFLPAWRPISAFGSGLYYGLAGLLHAFNKNAGINEKFAMYTDLVIFVFLAILFYLYY